MKHCLDRALDSVFDSWCSLELFIMELIPCIKCAILINVITSINRGFICLSNTSTKILKPKKKPNIFSIVILHIWEFFELLFHNISEILHTGGCRLNWVNLVKYLCHFYCIIFSYKHRFHWKCNLFITRLHTLDLGDIRVWNTLFEL